MRISIAGLMMIVVVAALISSLVLFAVRLQPEPFRVLTAVLLILVVLVAVIRRGLLLAFGSGFAIVGWCYFVLTCVNPTVMPTTRWLANVYEVVIGSPRVFTNPEDVVPFMQQLLDFLRVGHSILALLLGVAAGFVCLAFALMFRGLCGKFFLDTRRESSLPPQAHSPSLES